MSDDVVEVRAARATRWASVTEVAARIITPVTTMLLARILAPEAFGVIATISVVVSFADMFSDAGFQKYLVQHEFADDDERSRCLSVAFWTNLAVSAVLLAAIVAFRHPLASAVGSPAHGDVLAVASVQLLLTSFSSVQFAMFRRDLDFRTLFTVRMVGVSIPLVVAMPLALLGFGYWSLVISSIALQVSNAVLTTLKSRWRPRLTYDVATLRAMLSFSIWSLVEAFSIWLTSWVDILVIGRVLDEYHVGLYTTSVTMVNNLLAVITASTAPVLFAALSRMQDDDHRFRALFLGTQRYVALLVFPLGAGVFLYRDVAVRLLLGSGWGEAADVVGLWALTSAPMIVLGHYSSEAYRARGRPRLSFTAQVLHLIVLVPAILVSAPFGFAVLVMTRSLVRLQFVLVHLVIMHRTMGVSIASSLGNIASPAVATAGMCALALGLRQVDDSTGWEAISIAVCVLAYFGALAAVPKSRQDLAGLASLLGARKKAATPHNGGVAVTTTDQEVAR